MNRCAAYVDAVAFWSPRMTHWSVASQALRGECAVGESAATRPAPMLLPPNERRRAPDTVAISLEVASRACADAGVEPGTIASVFASTHGDLAITDYMCATIAESPESLSPTKFHNSVHNAAAGYWSIATGCMAPYTAVSAWQYTFAAGLLEALAQVHAEDRPVLMVAYDIEAKGPLAAVVHSEGLLACALLLSPRSGGNTLARLDWCVRAGETLAPSAADSAAARSLSGNAMAGSLPLLERLAGAGDGEVVLALGPALALDARVEMSARENRQ